MASILIGEAEHTFSTLGRRMSLFIPPEPAVGELIILCTWLGAAKKHIAKYVAEYRKIAPYAKILLIESSVWIITAPYAQQWEIIKPAAEVVHAVLCECGPSGVTTPHSPKLLIHTFSNGGTNSATQLLLVLRHRLGCPVPISGIICDSGPAQGAYWKDFHSMLTSLPKGILWQLIGPIVVFMICNILFGSQLLGWEKPEDIYRRTLLDEKVVGCKSICYIFSKADTHVDFEDIVSHADLALQQEWGVEKLLFPDTPHCNHISKYRIEYVEAIGRAWMAAGLKAEVP